MELSYSHNKYALLTQKLTDCKPKIPSFPRNPGSLLVIKIAVIIQPLIDFNALLLNMRIPIRFSYLYFANINKHAAQNVSKNIVILYRSKNRLKRNYVMSPVCKKHHLIEKGRSWLHDFLKQTPSENVLRLKSNSRQYKSIMKTNLVIWRLDFFFVLKYEYYIWVSS